MESKIAAYLNLIGIAIKNGIDRTKKTVAFSIGAVATYITNPIAKNIAVSRGKIPVIIKPNKISSPTKILLGKLIFDIFKKSIGKTLPTIFLRKFESSRPELSRRAGTT